MPFPLHRMRRLRNSSWAREMVCETHLRPSLFVEPFFVREGKGKREPVSAMPGVFQLTTDTLIKECAKSQELGIGAVILFGIPSKKDAVGSEGYSEAGIVPRAIRELKKALPGFSRMTRPSSFWPRKASPTPRQASTWSPLPPWPTGR